MSLSSKALYGFYIKCGVEDHYASVISETVGDLYLQLQSNARAQGLGTSSKSFGAVAAAEMVLDEYLNNGFLLPDDQYAAYFITACVKIYGAAICAISALAYENDIFSQQGVNEIIEKADEAFAALELNSRHQLASDKRQFYQEL